jgi:hypothetical protein
MTSVRGLLYPLQVSNGQLVLAEDEAIVEQQIISVLETRPFERIMRADYGLPDNIFETMNPAAIDSKISEAILEQVGGIDDLSVKGSWTGGDNGIYAVNILYSVRGTLQPPLSLSLVV